MKSLNLLVLAAALFIALPASAQQVKPYHQIISNVLIQVADEKITFVTPDNKACLTCHQSYAAVAEKTKNLKNGEPNPHASHHYGEGIACTACHSEHKTSQVYCNNCHEFKYQIK